MKIKVYTTINESRDSGNLNSSDKKYFNSAELRDDYFKNVLRKSYASDDYLEEYIPNNFCNKIGHQRWAYSIDKGEEEIEIIETKTWK
jgi:hypothetical protein